jgi:hypothetical protein
VQTRNRIACAIHSVRRVLPLMGMACLALPSSARAQTAQATDPAEPRIVVSKSIAIDRDGGALRLEFDDGADLSIELSDGEVRVDGETVGSYGGADSPLVTTWRDLLSGAARLENGELRRFLIDWSPGDGSDEAAGTLALRLDAALERALASASDGASQVQIRVVRADGGEVPQVEVTAGAEADSGAGDSAERTVVIDMRSDFQEQLRNDLRSEIEAQIRREIRGEVRPQGAIGRVFSGIGGALAQLLTVAVLGLFGAIAYHFAGPNLDAVARTAQRSPTRSLLVGLAGSFLLLPTFVLGIVALVLTIIGIPALLLWVPLFPVVVVLAMGLGYLAVARNLGGWVARQDLPYLGWVRETNTVTLILGGTLVLGTGFIMAELVSVLPFTSALELLLVVASSLLSTAVILIGFGAVILTRGGTRRPRSEGFDADLDLDLDWMNPWSKERRSARDPEAGAPGWGESATASEPPAAEPPQTTGADEAGAEDEDDAGVDTGNDTRDRSPRSDEDR